MQWLTAQHIKTVEIQILVWPCTAVWPCATGLTSSWLRVLTRETKITVVPNFVELCWDIKWVNIHKKFEMSLGAWEVLCCCWVARLCQTILQRHGLYSSPGSSVHGISQARELQWVAIFFSRGSSQPRVWTHVSCLGRWILYHWSTRKAWEVLYAWLFLLFPQSGRERKAMLDGELEYPLSYLTEAEADCPLSIREGPSGSGMPWRCSVPCCRLAQVLCPSLLAGP